MRGVRPFRFGVQLSGPADAAAWVEQARRIEDLGYSTVTMPDHFT
jgi:alkanesulfonate monooxygenase SsuD/methylene tetrahydromethanopterin reductase-like flavin-dependent oxidoreductase (luciferase family)